MKKIINGKKYDTETATLIHETYKEFDGNYAQKWYFRKKNGEFFYEHNSSGIYGCRGITPLSLEEAKDILQEELDGDKYEEIFGPVEE